MKFSLAIISSLAMLSVTSAFPTSLTTREAATCPMNVRSCTRTDVDSCCSPTNGLVVLAQQWEVGFGPEDAFTLHGLWPDKCNGDDTGWNGCGAHSRQYDKKGIQMTSIVRSNPTLYKEMIKYWPSNKGDNGWFWNHEWGTHGTCVSTMHPRCYSNFQKNQDVYDYFRTALQLRQKFDLYSILSKANITSGRDAKYHVDQIKSAIEKAVGVRPKLTCRRSNRSKLVDFMLYFYVKNRDEYVPTQPVLDPTPNPNETPCSGFIDFPLKYGSDEMLQVPTENTN